MKLEIAAEGNVTQQQKDLLIVTTALHACAKKAGQELHVKINMTVQQKKNIIKTIAIVMLTLRAAKINCKRLSFIVQNVEVYIEYQSILYVYLC